MAKTGNNQFYYNACPNFAASSSQGRIGDLWHVFGSNRVNLQQVERSRSTNLVGLQEIAALEGQYTKQTKNV
jgi:hypothetical protein